ncbi:TonB-dependent receptor [Undibacterium curvum]|uniref:TonB-dependent receptor n=1 Tax=Undibacterium curvum TaxID=2762294 RepID=A0ABR7A4M3_9BURK|nr:TonB-dependent receptor [Undibacterium curvum]MBC3931863.1 TonB-dependent receptor [Undibacterium curvum]
MKRNSTPGLTPIASAVALMVLSASMSAQAQQADQSKAQEVVVTGIRSALQSATNIKRNANSVVDAVSAEDVGKLPDTDVGESLGRIPGVSVGRAFGQGASVSVRGSDPQMTYTTLNGQTVASTGWYDQQTIDRSFNYSLLPSELIGGMDVYKSSQADLTEGGIGGTVIVKTRKPLDMAAGSAFVGAKLGKGTVSDGLSKDLSGLFSWKNDANSFGILVAAAGENGDYIRRGIESDSRWSADVAPTTFVQERKRTALNLSVQARPVKGLDIGLNYLKLQLDADNSNTSHYIFHDPNCTSRNAAVTSDFNPKGVCLSSNTSAAKATDAFLQTWARTAKMSSDSLTLNGTFKGEGYKIDAVAGTTKADGGTSMTTNYSYGSWTAGANLPKWTGGVDATGKQIILTPGSNQSVGLGNLPASAGPAGSWATSRGPNSDKENFAQADLLLNLDMGAISSFKTGFRASQHTFEKGTDRAQFAAKAIEVPTAGLYDGTIAMGTNGWSSPRPNISAMMANTTQNITGWVRERGGYGVLKEDNTAAYGMFNFEKDQWHGNFGARYVRTKATAEGYKLDGTAVAAGDIAQNAGWGKSIISQSADYNDILPSLNAAFDLNKNTILRFTASQAITRPNFDNMFIATQTGFQDGVAGNETVTYGSVGLKPMKSTQLDLGVEYYYGKGNLISLMYFHKDINNFITTNTKINQSIGVVSPDSGKDSWTVNQYVNAGGGKIDGIEAQINHSFDNGFGAVANYTLANATAPATSYQDQLNVFTLSSKHNVNLVGYWENPTYSARLAYNWRSKYMVRETGWYGNRMHDAYGTLDLSLGWNITDKVRIAFEATNLLKADDVQYGAAGVNTTVKDPLKAGYPAWSFMGETTYRVSVSAKF